MKPPPRTRKTPNRIGELAEAPRRPVRAASRWRPAEKYKLLKALKGLVRTAEPPRDTDYCLLEDQLPSRPPAEVRSVVEQLKKQVISTTVDRFQKVLRAEQSVSRPIEKWAGLAAAVTGRHEDAMAAAFSQMLMVSSTEPRTLRNRHPAGLQPPSSENHPETRRTRPLQIKTPPPTHGPVVLVPIGPPTAVCAGLRPPLQLQHRPHGPAPSSTRPHGPAPSSTRPHGPAPSSTRPHGPALSSTRPHGPAPSSTPRLFITVPAPSSTRPHGPAPSSTRPHGPAPSSTPRPLITPPSSSTSRTLGDKDLVDFQRIYCFLSGIQDPREPLPPLPLSAMESAIVLDLLMCLPEELRLLDCNKLHKHLTQVFQCYSAPADSKTAKQTFGGLRVGLCGEGAGPGEAASSQSDERMDVPPLNPFMVPLKLLRRRQEEAR